MENKELRKLSRKELLEILIFQNKKINELQEQLNNARTQLENRKIVMQKSGSMAEAALLLNRVFENADAAAQQYLINLKQILDSEQVALKRIHEKEKELQMALAKLSNRQEPKATSSCERRFKNEV